MLMHIPKGSFPIMIEGMFELVGTGICILVVDVVKVVLKVAW